MLPAIVAAFPEMAGVGSGAAGWTAGIGSALGAVAGSQLGSAGLEALPILGSLFSGSRARKEARRQEALQREFAQNAIQWRVADAQKAGIHPLYALGAAGAGYSPVQSAMLDYGAVGQDLRRSIKASMTPDQKAADTFTEQMRSLQLQNMGLQNRLLSEQINRMTQQPAQPVPSQFGLEMPSSAPPGAFERTPAKVTAARLDDPSLQAGPAVPGLVETELGKLGRWKLPQGQTNEALEDLELAKYAVILANNFPDAADAIRLQWRQQNAPEWVLRAERETGHRMEPFLTTDGIVMWRFKDRYAGHWVPGRDDTRDRGYVPRRGSGYDMRWDSRSRRLEAR